MPLEVQAESEAIMINVASAELCKELHKLSREIEDGKWDNTEFYWQDDYYADGSHLWNVYNSHEIKNGSTVPAYDLGYLLRKLPQNSWFGYTDTSGERGYALAYTYAWNEKGDDSSKIAERVAETPEDAACKLAIELWHRKMFSSRRQL